MSDILTCKRCKMRYDWSEGAGYDRDYCSCYCERTAKIDALKAELAEAKAYADKLAAGLPDGMLPKDVELLRQANADMATELAEARKERNEL